MPRPAVIVTGGGHGLGVAISRAFAIDHAVFIGYRTHSQGAMKLAEELGHGLAFPIAMDVRSDDSLDAAQNEIRALCKTYDLQPTVLVNNAGIVRDSAFAMMTMSDFVEVVDTNLNGTARAIQTFARLLLRQRHGAVVNVASIAALGASPSQANYAASKAGIVALTRTLAVEFAQLGVRVNAVLPGFIDAGMAQRIPQPMLAARIKETPLGRLGSAKEVADAVRFLASEQASFITGQALVVDGGLAL